MNTEPWLRRHPLVGYFALAYGITWCRILLVLASKGFDLSHPGPGTRPSSWR